MNRKNAIILPHGFAVGYSFPMGATWCEWKSCTNDLFGFHYWKIRILWFHLGRLTTLSGVDYEPDNPDGEDYA